MANSNNIKEQTRKFFIYARKSTDSEDRQVRSIGDQISELQELARKENLEIVDTIVEKQEDLTAVFSIPPDDLVMFGHYARHKQEC